jgi:hypothetical protein
MDYSASAIMSLWYSWANYYVQSVDNTLKREKLRDPVTLMGHIEGTNQLVLNEGQPGLDKLVAGMTVANGGIPGGTAIILAISSDHRTITLSKSANGQGDYVFTPPSLAAIAGSNGNTGSNPVWKLLTPFAPSGQTALNFARTVYEVMNVMSSTVAPGVTFPSVRLLANIIGANVAQLPNLNLSDPPTTNIKVIVTNQIISLLRGVPDYTNPAYSDPSQWYPNPVVPMGGQTFNVYNLDPFVWFVHEKLGLSGYGFSVDDDISFVGASGSTHVFVTVGGLGGLPNQSEWNGLAPYGPVKSTGKGTGNEITGLSTVVVNQVVGYNASTNVLGALVIGPGVKPGTTVRTTDPTGKIGLSEELNSNEAGTFYFFAPVVGTGTVGEKGQRKVTIVGLNAAAYNTLQLLGPKDGHPELLKEIQVTGPGIATTGPKTMIKSITQSNGGYIVTLSRDLELGSQPAGSYAYTFGHGDPILKKRAGARSVKKVIADLARSSRDRELRPGRSARAVDR